MCQCVREKKYVSKRERQRATRQRTESTRPRARGGRAVPRAGIPRVRNAFAEWIRRAHPLRLRQSAEAPVLADVVFPVITRHEHERSALHGHATKEHEGAV